jgi:hypothetical protein
MSRLRVVGAALQVVGLLVLTSDASAQMLTGSLVGSVTDESGAVLPQASLRLSSPALIGGPTVASPTTRGSFDTRGCHLDPTHW